MQLENRLANRGGFWSHEIHDGSGPRGNVRDRRSTSTALVRRYAHLSPKHLQDVMEKVASYALGRVYPEDTVVD